MYVNIHANPANDNISLQLILEQTFNHAYNRFGLHHGTFGVTVDGVQKRNVRGAAAPVVERLINWSRQRVEVLYRLK